MVETERLISVIGAGAPTDEQEEHARQVGVLLAARGWGLVCGGLGGVMNAAARGCAESGGLTVGILPGHSRREANPWCKVVIPTGLGQARNLLVVMAGHGAIAIGGGAGTLSEIGHALKMGRPVVGLGSWHIEGMHQAHEPEDAVATMLRMVE
ncbi:MAG: TIGR00725 family protein [Desulfarculaceae bacterium]|nr:TIGR00725 family protein [Desulfarculaceae bacterium]MCF8072738.1 TIGR00725 family protein [Desulfarculaceae bacterium]MCF8103028.1 TIGR00725 family protein [Desulfarculaceae bacterium]MCF8118107.1 TIGR00725 family protein [Desulfarculaceae bacterium]